MGIYFAKYHGWRGNCRWGKILTEDKGREKNLKGERKKGGNRIKYKR